MMKLIQMRAEKPPYTHAHTKTQWQSCTCIHIFTSYMRMGPLSILRIIRNWLKED